jgi:hypothetical protein
VIKHVSLEMDYWKPARHTVIDSSFDMGYRWSTGVSMGTDALYKRRTELSSDKEKTDQNGASRSSDQNRGRSDQIIPEWSKS